jgi:hypothetical protein
MNVNLLLDLTRISNNTGTIKLSPLIGQNQQPSGRLLLLPLSFTGATLLSIDEMSEESQRV